MASVPGDRYYFHLDYGANAPKGNQIGTQSRYDHDSIFKFIEQATEEPSNRFFFYG